ncbi:hypothetical protein V6N13_126716 [Hibiscus sabdariffa]|uniref:Uncharacterized protein n=1 Tax=Hibiscus sabdariffa TaxID=183260 RepID=A0ABR2RET9_9ROSI
MGKLTDLNDKKRLATTGANFARAYTVQFGTCKFPENFTGCQDLAEQKVPTPILLGFHKFWFDDEMIVGFADAESSVQTLMIWPWSVKGRTNTSAVPRFYGNGED